MNFAGLTPAMMAQVAALFGGLAFLLYLLKMRERLVPVSAHFLWDRVLRAGQRSLLARILRRVFSFLLQMLILGAVIFSMGEPRATATAQKPERIVLLLDESASMRAQDVNRGGARISRWEEAVDEARAIIRNKRENDEILLATYSVQAVSRTPWESDTSRLLSALEKLEPTDMPGRLSVGLAHAQEVLAAGDEPGRVVVITDAAGEDPARDVVWGPVPENCLDAQGTVDVTGMDIHHVPVAPEPGSVNVAITQLAARALPSDPDTGEVIFEAVNTGERPVKGRVDFYVDGNWRESRPLELAAGEEKILLIRLPLSGARLEARLSLPDDVPDPFPVDDRAWSVLPRKPLPRVLLVGRENLFLEAAMLLLPGTIRKVSAGEYRPALLEHCMDAAGDPCNFVVFNEFVPAEVPSTPNQLWIHPGGDPNSKSPFRVASRFRENLQILWTGGARVHAIMEGVSMKDVNLWGTSTAFALDARDRPLMQVDDRGTVLALLRTLPTGQRLVGLGFSLHESDFVLQVSFPVFVLNLINWAMGSTPGYVATYPTGAPREFTLDSDRLQFPDGRVLDISGAGLVFAPPYAGVYTFFKGSEPVSSVAASLLSAEESRIRPRGLEISCRPVPVWKQRVQLWTGSKSVRWKPLLALFLAGIGFLIMGYLRGAWGALMAFLGALALALCTVHVLANRGLPLWAALLGAAFVMLCVEWWSYHRRITV